MVCGATSDAGKSTIVAGLCRLLARRGVRVAPFKAQNMSLNSAVTADGAEIGRAQALQAAAAGIEPEAVMNPILLKPTGAATSQVVVLGRPVADVDPRRYHLTVDELWPVVLDALADLRARFDVVLLEGAGGAAEINLLDRDLVNLPLAQRADLPAIVVGDVERGGVFASLYGTWALLPDELRGRIGGFVVNRMRGDASLLVPGCDELAARTSVPVLGIVPWVAGLVIDAEDSLALANVRSHVVDGSDVGPHIRIDVAAVRFPHVSNFTDLDPLALEPGVGVRWVTSPSQLGRPGLVVLPGTKATVRDLEWFRSSGLAGAVESCGAPVLGICGGFQMMGTTIDDGVESRSGEVAGLGWLPVTTTFQPEKVVRRRCGQALGHAVSGYEIHHGVVEADGILVGDGRFRGTSVHGLFESDAFRGAFLGIDPEISFEGARQAQLDRVADVLEESLDLDRLFSLVA